MAVGLRNLGIQATLSWVAFVEAGADVNDGGLTASERELRGGGGGGGMGSSSSTGVLDEDDTSFCCCNDGYMYDGRDCVPCSSGYSDTQETPLTYNHSCEDNRVINGSDFWPVCALHQHQHACPEPAECCCDTGFRWTDESGCAPCADGTCADNLPILGSAFWPSCREANYHRCSYANAESGFSNMYCCCMPFTQWEGMCVASVVPVTLAVIPGSEKSWWCGGDQYACNPYPTSSEVRVSGALIGLPLVVVSVFVLCFCGWCGMLIRGLCRCGSRNDNKELKRRAKVCLVNGHPLVHMTCAMMVSRDRSYHQSWICDHCDQLAFPATPFLRCEQCGLDFCRGCGGRGVQ